MGSFTVNVPSDVNNQNKNITITSNGTEIISADSGYSGLGQVSITTNIDQENTIWDTFTLNKTVNGEVHQKAATGHGWNQIDLVVNVQPNLLSNYVINDNGLYSITDYNEENNTEYDGFGSVQISVPNTIFSGYTATITRNGQFFREETRDGYGWNYIDLDIDVEPDLVNNYEITSNGTYTIESYNDEEFEEKDGFGSVVVNCPEPVKVNRLRIKNDGSADVLLTPSQFIISSLTSGNYQDVVVDYDKALFQLHPLFTYNENNRPIMNNDYMELYIWVNSATSTSDNEEGINTHRVRVYNNDYYWIQDLGNRDDYLSQLNKYCQIYDSDMNQVLGFYGENDKKVLSNNNGFKLFYGGYLTKYVMNIEQFNVW